MCGRVVGRFTTCGVCFVCSRGSVLPLMLDVVE